MIPPSTSWRNPNRKRGWGKDRKREIDSDTGQRGTTKAAEERLKHKNWGAGVESRVCSLTSEEEGSFLQLPKVSKGPAKCQVQALEGLRDLQETPLAKDTC